MAQATQAAQAPLATNVMILSKIPEGITEQQVIAGAGRYTEVLQVSYRAADPDGPGWALVTFASPEFAKAARERLHGKALPGAPPGGTAAPLEAFLGEGIYGNVREQESPWKEARSPQGHTYYFHVVTRQSSWVKPPPEFAPVVPQSATKAPAVRQTVALPAAAAVQAAQAAIQAAPAAVAESRATSGAPPNLNSGPVGANLFIYHIPNTWDDSILRQHFEHFGKIVSCRVQTDGEGRPRGFGFVSFDTPSAAQAAIAGMHGFPVEGKHLKVQLKKGDEQQLAPPPLNMVSPGGGLLDLSGGLGLQPPPPPGMPGMPPAFTPVRMPAMPPPRLGPY